MLPAAPRASASRSSPSPPCTPHDLAKVVESCPRQPVPLGRWQRSVVRVVGRHRTHQGAVRCLGKHSGTRPTGPWSACRVVKMVEAGGRTPVPGQTNDDGRLDAGRSCVGRAQGRDDVGSAQWSAPQAGGAADGESCDSGSSRAPLERRKGGAGSGNGTSPILRALGADGAGGRLRSDAAAHLDQDIQRLLAAWPMIPEASCRRAEAS